MLYFYNPGQIDIKGATIAGLSKKEGDTPIGYFGTGLKYAIASILRWGGEITIWSGLKEFKFTTKTIKFRDAEYNQISMVSEGVETELGFTTEYGKEWLPWQVFREIYANALDEGGDVTTLSVTPEIGSTLIVVKSDELQTAYHSRDEIILSKNKIPVFSNSIGDIHKQPATSVYYRGVRVMDSPALYTYNVMKTTKLTEDRTVLNPYEFRYNISKIVMNCDQRDIIRTVLMSSNEGLEAGLSYYSSFGHSPEFLDVAKQLYKEAPNQYSKLKGFLSDVAPEMLAMVPVELNKVRQDMLSKAVRFCVDTKEFPDTFPQITVADLGQQALGMYDRSNNKIYLDPKTFDQGTKQVASTLYEELTHWHYGHEDCTYYMQTHLFNRIVSLYEEHAFGTAI